MSLSPRTRFGSFEIVEAIGVGGMGEVYRATDVNLARDVAIKVLPESLASDTNRIARFEREARTLAALNHPNIAHVYGLERSVARHGIVMELVEGPTLADRLARGPLAVDEALAVALQIVAALEAAHERGIVHRDLKPANVKLTADGRVKVLDFGIAKMAAQSDTAGPGASTEVGLTRSGFVLGTFPYMSPEQARGLPVDQRTDIWAFGCVLYELLTGRTFGEGEAASTQTDSASADVSDALPATVSPALRHTLRLCLQRNPTRRLADIRDVRLALEGALGYREHPLGQSSGRDARRLVPWLTALAATLVAAVALWGWLQADAPAGAPVPGPPLRLALDLGTGSSLGYPIVTALSPAGDRIVFVSTGPDGVSRLSTRRLDELTATPLPGTEAAYEPFFSPDGEWVGFFADGKLKKIRLGGGVPIVLCNAPAGRGASWGDDGWIVAALENRSGLARVSSSDGTVARFTELSSGQFSHRWPQILPGNAGVLFMIGHVSGNYAASHVAVARPNGVVKIVREAAGMAPHYLASGDVVYVSNGVLYAQAFDPEALEVHGAPTAVLDEVATDVTFGSAQLSFSRAGTVLYRGGRTPNRTLLKWLTSDGRTEALWDEPALYQWPHVSPDGRRLVATIADGLSAHIWVYDLERGAKTRITSEGVNTYPIWTPDGEYVVFVSQGGLHSARADGAERPEHLVTSENSLIPATFTPDGRLLYVEQRLTGRSTMYAAPISEESGKLRAGMPEELRELPSSYPVPALSPDGRWLAYASPESGSYEVYVRAFPDDGRQWTISTGGASFPVWSRTGNELFYRTENQLLMVVSYTIAGDSFVAARPRVWSERRLANTGFLANFDLAPDGTRFAALLNAEDPTSQESQPFILQANFFDEIRRRTGGGTR